MVNYSDTAFTSELRYEHVVLKSHITFSIAGNATNNFTIVHNLGYVPFFRLWYGFDSDVNVFTCFSGAGSFNIDNNQMQVNSITADSSSITVQLENFNASGTITGKIYYRIYAEAGS
jgi:hypothetical protein